MKKTKVFNCKKCQRKTVHILVDYDTVGQGLPLLIRGILCISSLGISEMKDDAKYQCNYCGHIRES